MIKGMKAWTTFSYTNLAITGSPASGALSGTTVPGGASSLQQRCYRYSYHHKLQYSFRSRSRPAVYKATGHGAEQSDQTLKGFEKVNIQAGQSVTVSIVLRMKDLAYWDTARKSWTVPKGSITASVEASRGMLG